MSAYEKPDNMKVSALIDARCTMSKSASEILKRCSSLLKQLRQHRWGWVFNEPVNAEALGCHDYYQVIKKPMDLGTIKKKLEDGVYKTQTTSKKTSNWYGKMRSSTIRPELTYTRWPSGWTTFSRRRCAKKKYPRKNAKNASWNEDL